MANQPLYPTYKPFIHVYEISSLIGKHLYNTKSQALYKLMIKDGRFRTAIEQIKRETNNQKESLVKHVIDNSRKQISDIAREFKVDETKNEDIEELIFERVRMKLRQLNTNAIPNFREQNIERRLLLEFKSQVQMLRGKLLEADSIDKYVSESYIRITKRNDSTFKHLHEFYTISGRLDGIDERNQCIIEIKNRMKFVEAVPEYDQIQCQAYMLLTGYRKSILVEHFPNNSIRETKIAYDEDLIREIEKELTNIVRNVKLLTTVELKNLIEQVDYDYDNATV